MALTHDPFVVSYLNARRRAMRQRDWVAGGSGGFDAISAGFACADEFANLQGGALFLLDTVGAASVGWLEGTTMEGILTRNSVTIKSDYCLGDFGWWCTNRLGGAAGFHMKYPLEFANAGSTAYTDGIAFINGKKARSKATGRVYQWNGSTHVLVAPGAGNAPDLAERYGLASSALREVITKEAFDEPTDIFAACRRWVYTGFFTDVAGKEGDSASYAGSGPLSAMLAGGIGSYADNTAPGSFARQQAKLSASNLFEVTATAEFYLWATMLPGVPFDDNGDDVLEESQHFTDFAAIPAGSGGVGSTAPFPASLAMPGPTAMHGWRADDGPMYLLFVPDFDDFA